MTTKTHPEATPLPLTTAHVPKLYGEPLNELPRDLFIPPDALEVYLEAFEGPLDLLLYLIRRASLNVLDIPMTLLTAQYLEYVEAMRRSNLELAAEYLLMAAVLLEIKSRMLLPRPPRTDNSEDEDPRAELVRRLLEYERMKAAAAALDRLPQAWRDFDWASVWFSDEAAMRQPEVNLFDLQVAWLAIMKQAQARKHHTIAREELSVREHMTQVLRHLAGKSYVVFEELCAVELGLAGMVVTFLAVLELARERLIQITQTEILAPIYLRLAENPTTDAEPEYA